MDTLLSFEQSLIDAERPMDETLKENPVVYYDLPALIGSDNARLVVAEVDGIVVGCGYARIERAKPYLQHTFFAYLGFMFVLSAFRGRGINKAVIDNLADWSLSKGITELRLDVYDQNKPAIKAYEKAGFRPHMIEMRMEIKPAHPGKPSTDLSQ